MTKPNASPADLVCPLQAATVNQRATDMEWACDCKECDDVINEYMTENPTPTAFPDYRPDWSWPGVCWGCPAANLQYDAIYGTPGFSTCTPLAPTPQPVGKNPILFGGQYFDLSYENVSVQGITIEDIHSAYWQTKDQMASGSNYGTGIDFDWLKNFFSARVSLPMTYSEGQEPYMSSLRVKSPVPVGQAQGLSISVRGYNPALYFANNNPNAFAPARGPQDILSAKYGAAGPTTTDSQMPGSLGFPIVVEPSIDVTAEVRRLVGLFIDKAVVRRQFPTAAGVTINTQCASEGDYCPSKWARWPNL